MALLRGENQIIEFKIDDEYIPIGCLSSNSLSEVVEMLSTTTKDNGGWATSIPTNHSYTISFSAFSQEESSTTLSYQDVRSYKRLGTLIEWRIRNTDTGNADLGSGYITSVGESASAGELITFDCELTGYGLPLETILANTLLSETGVIILSEDGQEIISE